MKMKISLLVCAFAICCVVALPPAGTPDETDAGYPQLVSAKFIGINNDPVDCVFQRSNGKIYIFSGDMYYRLKDKYTEAFAVTDDMVDDGYPKSILANWGIHGPVDVCFQRDSNGKIYFFHADKYWRFTDKYLVDDLSADAPDAGYPLLIKDKFLGLPDDVESGFYRLNAHMYFFKGGEYFRIRDKYFYSDMDSTKPDEVEGCYPKTVAGNWLGLPADGMIRGIFQRNSNKQIYAFMHDMPQTYYKFTDKYLKASWPDRADKGYPQLIADKWPQCTGNSRLPDSVDAMFQRPTNGKFYAFKGTQYWRISDKNLLGGDDCVDAGYPKLIADKFIGLPNDVSAAFYRSNGYMYFFKDTVYYKVSDKYLSSTPDVTPDAVVAGYETGKSITTNFVGVPTPVQAVFERISGHIYFFQAAADGMYYRMMDKYFFAGATDTVESGYPKSIAQNWIGVLQPIDTVFQRTASNDHIYFFSADKYVRVSDKVISEPAPCCQSGDTIMAWEGKIEHAEEEAAHAKEETMHAKQELKEAEAMMEEMKKKMETTHNQGPQTAINLNFAHMLAGR